MSDNILQPDPEALHQSAIDILTHVSNVMEQGSTLLQEHDRLLAENHDDYRLGNEIESVEQDLRYVKSDLKKVKQRELTMTIVTPTSADKSMIINTIARFINTAIAPMVADAKPSSIGIKAALKDTGVRLSNFQSCIERQKGMIDRLLRKAEDDIKWIEADLKEIEIIKCNDRWQIETIEYLLEYLPQIAFKELDIIFKNQQNLINQELEHNLQNLEGYRVKECCEEIANIYVGFIIKQLEDAVVFYLDDNTKTKLIGWTNNYFNHSHNSLFHNAQRRLSVNLTFLPWACLEDVKFRNPRLYLREDAYLMRDKLGQIVHYESLESSINDWRNIDKKELFNSLTLNSGEELLDKQLIVSLTQGLISVYGTSQQYSCFVDSIKNPPTVLSDMILHRYKSISKQIMTDLFILVNNYEIYLSNLLRCNQERMRAYLILNRKYIRLVEDTSKIAKNTECQQRYNKEISDINHY